MLFVAAGQVVGRFAAIIFYCYCDLISLAFTDHALGLFNNKFA
jgi:hypothetical protein